MKYRTRVLLMLIFLSTFIALACRDFDDRAGSSGLFTGVELSMAGVWKGEWATTHGSGDLGTVTLALEQGADGKLAGCSCWQGSACWDDGDVAVLTIEESNVAGKILDIAGGGFAPTRIRTSMVLGFDLVVGTFEVVANDPARSMSCNVARTGDEGSIELTRESSDIDIPTLCAQFKAAGNCFDVAF